MTGKEKLTLALNHKSGPVPVDFGAAPTTGMHVSMVEKLRDYYGLEKRPVIVQEPGQMLGVIQEDLAAAMGVDTMPLWSPYNLYGFVNENYKEWKTPWNQVVLVPEAFHVTYDEPGAAYLYPCGDKNAQPCAKMPASGYFFDTIIRQPEIDEDNLNPDDNTEEFTLIPDSVLDYYKAHLAQQKDSSRGIIANWGGTGFGDIALVPAPMLKAPKGIRDIEEWYVSTLIRQDYIHQVFEKQCDVAIKNLEKIYKAVGDGIQVAYICGTDLGTQDAPFCSLDNFKNLYMPYYKRVNGWIHENTNWKTFKHCCGSIFPLIEGLIESGFDILNPVQWTANGMPMEKLKETFGEQLVFWGGGVNTQGTLPFGKPSEVREEVLKACDVFSKNGGFVFNTIHNVQAQTPIENLVALIDAVHEFNGEK